MGEPAPASDTQPEREPPARSVVLVPHTHWDREWYLPFEGFLELLVRMMDGLIDVLDREPRFAHFHLDGQAAMIDDYLDVRPEREGDIRRLAAAGRISVGPWYTQMDEFLVSGESHIRNLERGQARARDLCGSEQPVDGPVVGYLPDQFGHIGQMPQILRAGGVEHAVVWRGVPASIDRTAFWWRSPDGSEVLTEYLAFGYGLGGGLHQHADATGIASALGEAVRWVEPFAARERILITVGADHAIPQAELAPLLPEVNRISQLRAEFGSLSAYVEGPAPAGLPSWAGELRSAARAHLLPNVYSSRIHQKRERARVEAMVERYAEPLAALVPGFDWPAAELDRAWRLLLWNGAHDSACGCSVDEVGRAVDARFAEARGIVEGIVVRALSSLASRVDVEPSGEGKPSVLLRFNPSPFEREGVPGLGWSATGGPPAEAGDATRRRLALRLEDGWFRAGDVAFRLVDEADRGDLYNFCPSEEGPPAGPDRFDARDEGGTAVFGGLSVSILPTSRADEPFVRLDLRVRNERPDHRVRLHVRLPEPADGAVAGSPFELVERPLLGEGSDLEAPSPTWPARGLVLAGGLAVLAEGVFEYEVVDGRELAVTILRCTGTISRQSIATRPWPAGPDIATPEAQMIGATELTLGVLQGATAGDLLPAWERLALPLWEFGALRDDAATLGSLASTGSLLQIEGAELSSVRRSGGALEVRVWNPMRTRRRARVGGRDVELGPARIETLAP